MHINTVYERQQGSMGGLHSMATSTWTPAAAVVCEMIETVVLLSCFVHNNPIFNQYSPTNISAALWLLQKDFHENGAPGKRMNIDSAGALNESFFHTYSLKVNWLVI